MSDLQQKIDEASTRLLALRQERSNLELSAQAHEKAAREDRLAMSNLKREIEELSAVIRHAGVQKATEDAAEAAKHSKNEVEKTLARLVEKEKLLDARLAELPKTVS